MRTHVWLPGWPLSVAISTSVYLLALIADASWGEPLIPETSTGLVRFVVDPSPSWPLLFQPQHTDLPVLCTAHVWNLPALTATTSLSGLESEEEVTTLTGEDEDDVLPRPSCPFDPAPQHFTCPDASSAQECDIPTATETAPVSGVESDSMTCTGLLLFEYGEVVTSPS